MLHRNFMPRSDNAALKERERRFDGISCDAHLAFVTDVFFRAMIDALVLGSMVSGGGEVIEIGFISHDDIDSLVHILGDNLVHLLLIQGRICLNEVEMAAALTNADYWRVFLPLVGVLCVAADVHLVHFNRASEFMIDLSHSLADSVAEIPCGFVTDSKCALELVSRHPLSALTEQVSAEKPLPQIQMCIVEDGCCGNTELVMT